MLNKLHHMDAAIGLKQLAGNSIDLIVTSPPYLQMKKSYPGYDSDDYLVWFLPLAAEMFRALKDDASFVLNINDGCEDGERSTYVFELVLALKKIGFHYFDRMVWVKPNGTPTSGKLRRADYFEYIFQFTKGLNPTFNVDEIRIPYASASLKRAQSPIKKNVSNKEARTGASYKKWELHPRGAWPRNTLPFPKDGGKTAHVAPFHIELPSHFIKAHSNSGETILDPFAGKGTSLRAAQILGRNFIGFEIMQEYVMLSKEVYPELWV